MRRATVAAVGMIGLFIAIGLSASAVAAPKGPTKHTFTETDTGATISMNGASYENVFKAVNSANGTGAGITEGSITGTTGKGTTTIYFAKGVVKNKSTFKLGAPNASGIGTITGSGKCVGGTGAYKNNKCTFTFTGTYSSTSPLYNDKVTGITTTP